LIRPRGRNVLLMLALLLAAPAPVQAQADAPQPACKLPGDLALTGMDLPAVRTDVHSEHRLTILAVGGASTAGAAVGGGAFAYPARLEAHLQTLLPGVAVTVINRGRVAGRGRTRADLLASDLTEVKPDLVIWAPGGRDAGVSEAPDVFAQSLEDGLGQIGAAGADTIFIDLQYAPSIALVIDLDQYNNAIADVANAHDIPVLRRSELMRRWSEDGSFDLDHTPPANWVAVERHLFDCLSAGLAAGIAKATK
jgi:acyl-CoA thioesterase-1